MVERALLAAVLFALVTAALLGARWLLDARRRSTLRRLQGQNGGKRDHGALPSGGRILYFSTRHCVQCRQLQEPALDRLVEAGQGLITVEKVDAVEREDLAKEYRVLTVPTTAVFDSTGALVEINHGYAPAERLARQLGLSGVSLPPAPSYHI